MRNRPVTLYSLLIFLTLLTGWACTLGVTAPNPTPAPSPAATPGQPTPTTAPVPPTAVPPAPVKTVHALVSVNSLNLRNGPGQIFEAIAAAEKGDLLTLIGKTPGSSDWVLVQKPDGKSGWASVEFIDLQGVLVDVQPVNMDFTLVVHGKTLDAGGNPADKMTIAVYQGDAASKLRTDVKSDSSGDFVAYLPKYVSGPWNIEVVGYDCTSRIAQVGCQFPGHFTPPYVTIDPLNLQSPVVFKYSQ